MGYNKRSRHKFDKGNTRWDKVWIAIFLLFFVSVMAGAVFGNQITVPQEQSFVENTSYLWIVLKYEKYFLLLFTGFFLPLGWIFSIFAILLQGIVTGLSGTAVFHTVDGELFWSMFFIYFITHLIFLPPFLAAGKFTLSRCLQKTKLPLSRQELQTQRQEIFILLAVSVILSMIVAEIEKCIVLAIL
ncbi:MAG: stage II sporulation protein M [Clostridiales bacterium]|nr:stage II sporulation protein M [Clostridiales bacterium]